VAKIPADIRSLARGYTNVCIKTLGGIAKDGNNEQARISAAAILLDRGWGKPQQDNTLELKGEIKVVLRKLLSDDEDE
jgi:hypothetical protein